MSVIYGKLLLMALFWGGTFVAGRIVSQDVGPFSAAFLRFALASACLLALTLYKEGGLPRLRPPQVLAVLVLGLTGVFAYNVLFFEGLKTVAAGRAAVIVTCNPIFTALAAAIVFREPLNRWKIVGILLSVSGAILAITQGQPWRILSDSITWGDAAFLGCITVWVVYSLVGKRMLRDISPLAAVTWASLVGTVALLIPALNEGLWSTVGHTPTPAWISIAYLGILGTVVSFTWYYEGIRAIGAARAAVFINIVPVSAILAAYFLLDEPIHLSLLVGGLMVGCGVYLANKPTRSGVR
jgi:drug/metabolite transporter (DMT)-like permease